MVSLRTLMTCGAALLLSQAVTAQTPTRNASAAGTLEPRWDAFIGCWRPSRGPANSDMQLCIVPSADGKGVTRVTFSGTTEVLSETVVADGTTRTLPEKECSGTQMSRWAASGARLLMSSTLTCPGKPPVVTTGMSAQLSSDQWLDIQTIQTPARGEQTRVQRFWRSDSTPPASVADALAAHPLARIKMQAPSISDVIDASTVVGPSVVEAWLSEGAIAMPVARTELLRLSNAHVDARVIDLMVAMAYPEKFEVRRQSYGGSASGVGMVSDFYPGDWGILASQYGLGYGIYGVPYFFRASYGFDQPGGLYFVPTSSPGGPIEPATHGQVVNGQGYTRVQVREPFRGTATATASSTRDSTGDSGSSSGAGSGGDGGSSSSGASPSGYSGGGGSSTGLTAVPR
jgi:hypothetical protein